MVDAFTPKDRQAHSYDSWFHFKSSDCAPVLGGYTTTDRDEANLAIIPLDMDGVTSRVILGEETPEVQGWIPVGPVNTSVPTPVATPSFHKESAGITLMPYILCPSRPGEGVRIRKVRCSGNGRYKVFFEDGSCDKIRLTFDGHAISKLSINGKDVLTGR